MLVTVNKEEERRRKRESRIDRSKGKEMMKEERGNDGKSREKEKRGGKMKIRGKIR